MYIVMPERQRLVAVFQTRRLSTRLLLPNGHHGHQHIQHCSLDPNRTLGPVRLCLVWQQKRWLCVLSLGLPSCGPTAQVCQKFDGHEADGSLWRRLLHAAPSPRTHTACHCLAAARQRRCPAIPLSGRRQTASAAAAAAATAATAATEELTITRPDDWHLHVRDGAGLRSVVPHTARHYGRAVIMPNTVPPVTTAAAAVQYRQRIAEAAVAGAGSSAGPSSSAAAHAFTPLMTCYLTDKTPPDEVQRAKEVGA